MIEFLYHEGARKEIAALERRFRHIRQGLAAFELICQTQFHPIEPKQVVSPGKLHRITQNELWNVWKIELVIPKSGLRPNQYPRMWFAVQGSRIAILYLGTHGQNYEDKEREISALARARDIF